MISHRYSRESEMTQSKKLILEDIRHYSLQLNVSYLLDLFILGAFILLVLICCLLEQQKALLRRDSFPSECSFPIVCDK